MLINRRAVLAAMAASLARPTGLRAADMMPIADMHAHLFFIGTNPAARQPLRRNMASGGVTLVSWSLVGDMPWIRRSATGLKQNGAPKRGAATAWFREELERIHRHLAEQKLKVVRTPVDIERALSGEPHVVLSVEGATFLDDGLAGLEAAYDGGVRHLQLVHYARNTIGDFQTEAPAHGGLTAFGRDVIREANRLGILIDLAHGTKPTVEQALEISRSPVVWSHSSIARGEPNWRMPAWRARQISAEEARAIAAKGGVVGLWALPSDVGSTIESYANRLLQMAQLLGDDHVAFGTDLNAIANSPIKNYADLRRVVTHLEARGVERSRLRKISIGNYARVLNAAMVAGKS